MAQGIKLECPKSQQYQWLQGPGRARKTERPIFDSRQPHHRKNPETPVLARVPGFFFLSKRAVWPLWPENRRLAIKSASIWWGLPRRAASAPTLARTCSANCPDSSMALPWASVKRRHSAAVPSTLRRRMARLVRRRKCSGPCRAVVRRPDGALSSFWPHTPSEHPPVKAVYACSTRASPAR